MLEEQDLDRADFDAVEYINRQFPTEASLEGLDAFLARTESEIAKLNTSISEVRSAVPFHSCSCFVEEMSS